MDINSLKASFCRQHFPDLMQFLRKFDISECNNENGSDDFENDLNMHFLLHAYDEEKVPNKRGNESDEDYLKRKNKDHENFLKNQRDLKANCKWSFDDVNEADVLLATEEYFKIVSEREDTEELASILVSSIITEKRANTLFLGDSINRLYHFEDDTTLSILQHLNITIHRPDKTLGIQRNAFSQFIFAAAREKGKEDNPQNKIFSGKICAVRPEVQFVQAFELLASIRNWENHEYISFMNDAFHSYCLYRFIVFTHIGLIYFSRRLWNNDEASKLLSQNDYSIPSPFKTEATDLKVSIRANNRMQTIYDCEYKICDEERWHPINVSPQNEIVFSISLQKYQLYKIRFKCNNEKYDVVGKLNYYAWEPVLNVFVKPPRYISYSFEGIVGDDKETEHLIGEMFTKYMEINLHPKKDSNQEIANEEILLRLGAFEPLLQELKNSEEAGKENLEKIRDQINSELSQLKNEQQRIIDVLCESNGRLYKWERLFKGVFVLVVFMLACCVLYYCIKEPVIASVKWLQNQLLCISVILVLLYLVFITPCKSWDLRKAIKEKGKAKWAFSLFFLGALSVAFVALPHHSGRSILENYDFIWQDSTQNRLVAQYLDDYLPNDEERVRSKLALYYADIVNDFDEAYKYSAPLLDVEKYKEGSLVAMYVLYCQKEIPTLSSFLDRYKDYYGEDNLNYCELKGALLVDTLYGYRDIYKGYELLLKAYKEGSSSAGYNLGYLLSNDESTMEAIEQGRNVQNSIYNLPLAIGFLKAVCDEYPKASVLLGDIYSDLSLVDSAFHYYEKAITETMEGGVYKYACYRAGVLKNIFGLKPNDELLAVQSMKYPPALMFSSIAMELDPNLIAEIGYAPYTRYFHLLFNKRDHKRAIRWFEDAIKNGGGFTLKEMGVYQYIPPVVFDHIYIGEKDKALAVLQKYRSSSKFDATFVDAVELLLGSALVKRDSVKGMQLMHESAANGCVYSKLFCIYKDTDKSLISNTSSFIDQKQLKKIAREIPFAHVIESLLLMRAGKTKEAAEAAHMAIWKKHPAGAYALEFMPSEYYDDVVNGIANGIKNASENDLIIARKLQEMSLRSTCTMKDRSLLMSCVLDKAVHDKGNEDFSRHFVFWSQVAVETSSLSSQIKLLRIYQDMIYSGYKDDKRIIYPLIRSVLFNLVHGEYNYYPSYNNYILHFIRDRKLISESYFMDLLNSYATSNLLKKLEEPDRSNGKVTIEYYIPSLSFIDDFSILNEFTYHMGIYSFLMRLRGNHPTFNLLNI